MSAKFHPYVKDRNRTITLKKTKLAEKRNTVEQHMGKYPVIFIDFMRCAGLNYTQIESGLDNEIDREFRRHGYLQDSSFISKQEKQSFLYYIKNHNLTFGDKVESFFFLSELLSKHWKEKVMVFIGEYDNPISEIYSNFLVSDKEKYHNEIEMVVELFKQTFQQLLKSNKLVCKAMITGIMHVENAGFLSALNNKIEYGVSSPGYTKGLYGFTDEEIHDLQKELEIETQYQFKSWYNGYIIGGLPIYNP